MHGSGKAVSLAQTCTREEDWVNQAEHLDARVAKASEGTDALWRLDIAGKAAPQSRGGVLQQIPHKGKVNDRSQQISMSMLRRIVSPIVPIWGGRVGQERLGIA